MYVCGKRFQKGSTHSSSALQQRRTDGRRHTRETTETGACDHTGRSWKGRRNEKGGKIAAYFFSFFSLGARRRRRSDSLRAGDKFLGRVSGW